MARQTGIIQLSGPLGGISFYRHKKYGMLARACNPVSAQRIAKDPAFARTRENGTEFGMVSRAGKLLRDGLKGFLRDVPTEGLDLKVMRKLMEIKAQDTVSPRGQRHVGVALGLRPELLGGLVLSSSYGVAHFLAEAPVVNSFRGTITLPAFVPQRVPEAATHVAVTGFRGRFTPLAGAFGVQSPETVVIQLATPLSLPPEGRSDNQLLTQDIILRIPEAAGEGGIEIWGLKIVFFQEVNGEMLPLKGGAAAILHTSSAGAFEVRGNSSSEGFKVRGNSSSEGFEVQGTASAGATDVALPSVPAADVIPLSPRIGFDPVGSESVVVPLATPLSLPSEGRSDSRSSTQDLELRIPEPVAEREIRFVRSRLPPLSVSPRRGEATADHQRRTSN